MNKDPFLKLQSSKTIEELLNDTGVSHSQNWLLSYLDVFVLMVMLIITLISLGDLRIEEEARDKAEIKAKTATPFPPPVQKRRPVPTAEADHRPVEPIIAALEPEPEPAPVAEPADNAVTAPGPLPAASTERPSDVVQETGEAVIEMPAPQQPMPAPIKREIRESDLTDQLEQLGLDQTVTIKITEDYAQLEIQDKILFESSEARLTRPGKALLDNLAPLLKKAIGLIFIEGHTDNRPINTPQFPSNWELGSARATSVLHYLTTQGLDGSRMRAVTYADTMPVADNSTVAGREKNRRVSILLKIQEQDITP